MAICVEELAEINIFHKRVPKIAYLPVSDVNLVALPADYIDFIKPPSIIVNGKIWPLTELGILPLQAEQECGNDTNPPVDNLSVTSGDTTNTNNFLTETPDTVFGYALGQSGGQNLCYYRSRLYG